MMLTQENLTRHSKLTAELTSRELLAIMKERVRVFVVEQECAYQEVDDLDEMARHVWFSDGDKLVAYARIIQDGDQVKFGRVLVAHEYRGHHLAQKLVDEVLAEIAEQFPNESVFIQAQSYLEKFYASFGFETISDEYLEDNIPHKDMLLTK